MYCSNITFIGNATFFVQAAPDVGIATLTDSEGARPTTRIKTPNRRKTLILQIFCYRNMYQSAMMKRNI